MRLIAEAGETGPALVELSLSKLTPFLRHARVAVLQNLANKSGDSRPLSVFLHDSFVATGDPLFLLESYRVHAELEDRSYIEKHAKTLLGLTDTAAAVEPIANYTAAAGQYQWAWLKTLDSQSIQLRG